LELDGSSCYYEKSGSGEPVLLLHGGFCSIETMRPQIDVLSQSYEVHAPERPGHGRSGDRGDELTYDQGMRDTIAYLDAVGLERAHVVGFSDGAVIGLLMAINVPLRLRSLVVISGNLSPAGLVEPDLRERAMSPQAMTALSAEHDRLAPDGGASREDLLRRLMRMWSEEPDIAPEELDAVNTPTMVMAGDHDLFRLDHSALMADRLGGELCVIPNASHMLMLERPSLVNAVLSEFLAAHSD
jgi:pimeloyl-ACP methyl ester carboxylesterase